MKIALGTKSDSKLGFLKQALNFFDISGAEIIQFEVESGVDYQPIGEIETRKGSLNRARNAKSLSNGSEEISIGLEAGLEFIEATELFYLVCVCTVIDKDDNIYVGVSSKTPLPKVVSLGVENKEQFGELIRNYKESSAGNFETYIDRLVKRDYEFNEAIKIAFNSYLNKSHFV